MLLNDDAIRDRATKAALIHPFEPGELLNCSYWIHADRAFEPETGKEIRIGDDVEADSWTIAPGGWLIVQTVERVKLPNNLMAMYTQLNRWAVRGLSLMNASLVEPEYDGPLSCQLVNFSRYPIRLQRKDRIAKLTFHEMLPAIGGRAETVTDVTYSKRLAESAYQHPASLLDVGRIEERVSRGISARVWTVLGIPAAVLAGLIAIAALEPYVAGYVASHNGISLDANAKEVTQLREELRHTAEISKLQADQSRLQASIEKLTTTVQQLKNRK